MISLSIDEFSLDWIRSDIKLKLSNVHPEADAFQQLCGDILSDAVFREPRDNSAFISFSTSGKDGAIDHLGVSTSEETIIVECKKTNSLKSCLAEIGKLENTLSRNLNKKNAHNTIYSPWFNKKLKQYILCTSCRANSANEYNKIKDAVVAMMQHLGSSNNSLSHLKTVEVKIYHWQQLKGLLEKSDLLMHKWVQPGITGVEYISHDIQDEQGYRSYLSSNIIPYFSRDDFMQSHPHIDDLPSEKKYFSELFNNPRNQGLIIHGQGGIGKTRLLREFGLMASNNGWVSYQVSRSADFDRLFLSLRPGGKYILLFDYIEEIPHFSQWVESLKRERRNFEVKFIGNCRSSYVSTLKSRLHDIVFTILDISNSTESSRLYYLELVNRIVPDIPTLKSINNRIFEYRPSFATFIRYLYDLDKSHQFDLRENENFRTWIIRRLELSLSRSGDVENKKELVAMIFACLPAHGTGREFLEHNYTDEINILIADGWVEERNDKDNYLRKHLAVIHDSVADEVLLEYLDKYKRVVGVKVNKVFEFAARNSVIDGCIRSFERIVDSPPLQNVDYVSAITRIIDDYPEVTGRSFPILNLTPLLSNEQRTSLYLANRSFFNPYITSPDYSSSITYFGYIFSRANEQHRQNIIEVYNWWYSKNRNVITSNPEASLLIATHIQIAGLDERAKKYVEEYLSENSLQHGAYVVILAWLYLGGEKSFVQYSLANWLSKYENDQQAFTVFEAWLNVGGERKVVQAQLANWLKKYETIPDAITVYEPWLYGGGDKELIKDHMVAWLKQHEAALDAFSLIALWLRQGGETKIIEPSLINALRKNDSLLEASIAIGAWLEVGGDKEVVMQHVINWLRQQYNTEQQTYLVVGSWLNAGGDKDIVEHHLLNWLKQYEGSLEAGTIIGLWLREKGDTTKVQTHVSSWMKQHDSAIEAEYILAHWIDAGGNKEFLQDHLLNWLHQHGATPTAQYIYSSWLRSGVDTATIKDHLVDWLKKNITSPKAWLVIVEWLNGGGDKDIVRDSLVKWLDRDDFPQEASTIFHAWRKAKGLIDPLKEPLLKWLKAHDDSPNAIFILMYWITERGDNTEIQEHLVNWLKKHSDIFVAHFVYSFWLRTGGNKSLIKPYLESWLQQHNESKEAQSLRSLL